MIETAATIAVERGLVAMSVAALSDVVGTAVSTAEQHFGSREGLIAAIVVDGMAPVNERRLVRLTGLGADASLRDLVEALVIPLAEVTVGRPGSTYARFLHQGLADPMVQRVVFESLTATSYREVRRLIDVHPDFVTAVAAPLRNARLDHAVVTCIAALAFWEGAVAHDSVPLSDLPTHVRVGNLVDVTCATLSTPSSPSTLAALAVAAGEPR